MERFWGGGMLFAGRFLAVYVLLGMLIPAEVQGQASYPVEAEKIPAEVRVRYRNPDGSCVQCSIGMCGADQNDANSASLLWDSIYGPAERGGSGPQRVAEYCNRRGIKAWNVTGPNTWDWMRWASDTGRMAAIGAGHNHFQTLCWYDRQRGIWWVCNNNSPTRIDAYNEREFRSLHLASGQWVVILDRPPSPPRAIYRKWW